MPTIEKYRQERMAEQAAAAAAADDEVFVEKYTSPSSKKKKKGTAMKELKVDSEGKKRTLIGVEEEPKVVEKDMTEVVL